MFSKITKLTWLIRVFGLTKVAMIYYCRPKVIHVDDAARAFVLAAEHYDKSEPVNIGSGFEISIKDLCDKILDMMDMKLKIKWNTSYPNGQPHRALDISKAFDEFGFRPKMPFDNELKELINSFVKNQNLPQNGH